MTTVIGDVKGKVAVIINDIVDTAARSLTGARHRGRRRDQGLRLRHTRGPSTARRSND